MLSFIVAFLTFIVFAHAKTVTYDWDIGWVTASPDGYERPVIGINGEWPCPTVQVDLGDRLVVHVTNSLGNQSTSLHWHGQNQRGTPFMDGTSGVAQCPIPPGSHFTYDFTVSHLRCPVMVTWLTPPRLRILEHSGTTRTIWASTRMDCVAR